MGGVTKSQFRWAGCHANQRNDARENAIVHDEQGEDASLRNSNALNGATMAWWEPLVRRVVKLKRSNLLGICRSTACSGAMGKAPLHHQARWRR